jgi:pimeloyl-ACP methyl ester carboxylesterase
MATALRLSRFVEVDGRKLHYLDWGGGGPPLVMLHGFTGHAHTWDHSAAALGHHYRVVALDQRGHGDSDWASGYGTRPMVRDVLSFLDAADLGQVILMGLSMGGNVAYLFAAAHPERVERLVVLDIGPEISSVGAQRIAAGVNANDLFESEDEAVAQARADNPRPTDADLRRRVSHNLRPLPNGMLTFKWDKVLRDGRATRDDHTIGERWSAWRAVRCPVLLVRGDDSDILSPETARRMLEENTNATLSLLADCGHSITLDRPQGLLDAVAPWLAATGGQRRLAWRVVIGVRSGGCGASFVRSVDRRPVGGRFQGITIRFGGKGD